MTTVAANPGPGAIGAGQINMMAGGTNSIIPMATIVKPNDLRVIEMAQFAVVSYNEQADTDLVFINVNFGFCWSHHGGRYYMLAFKTQDDMGTYCHAALVRNIVVGNGHTSDLIWYNNKTN